MPSVLDVWMTFKSTCRMFSIAPNCTETGPVAPGLWSINEARRETVPPRSRTGTSEPWSCLGRSGVSLAAEPPYRYGKQGRLMPEPMEQGGVVVRGGAEGFVQQITVGGHRLMADEPVSSGGTDRGPGPYELLLAALGA